MGKRNPAISVACIAALMLAAACGQSARREPSPAGESSMPSPEQATADAPTGGETRRRAPRKVDACAGVEKPATVIYTIHTRPTTAGKELWVTLTVHNGLSRGLYVQVGGALGVTEVNPGTAPLVLWGGSSADVIKIRPDGEWTHEVVSAGPQPLSIPATARVSGISAYASLFPVRGRGHVCSAPARVKAPRGLVVGHPDGNWVLPTGRQSVRQHNAIYRQACGAPGGPEPAPC